MADALGSARDQRFLAAVIRLGAGALGTTWPNPSVGAVLTLGERVVGRARTAPGGRPHGETLAFAQAGAAARGSTLYVSLEPCSHHGRTPPCVDAIIEAGVIRVVAAVGDPDPRVAGRGFARLREAGIEVLAGRVAEAEHAHAGHFSRVTRGRPWVTLKLAVSADDAIGLRGEPQVTVTGPGARRHAQALRSRFDAVLVGRGTVEGDDPELTCRLPGLERRSPVRIVLDTNGRLGSDRKVFRAGPAETWVFTAKDGPVGAPGAGRRITLSSGHKGLDFSAVLTRLAAEGITRLLVEGGAQVARSLLEADLVDEVMLFRSPAALGGHLVPALAGLPLSAVERSARYRRIERRSFGADRMTRYTRER